jgi:CDP-glucose 4,6-dehydratase
LNNFWQGKRVLITGHTGFKGTYLSLMLRELGAEIHGLSLPPEFYPNIYDLATKGIYLTEALIDLREPHAVGEYVQSVRPEIVFHLAAQASVLEGYRDPLKTWTTNVIGTLNLIESLMARESPSSIVVATTDKVYLNSGEGKNFVEENQLGGGDPYSASKVAVEELINSYRHVCDARNAKLRIAVARAGNVIGGGDWLPNRIIPDALRAIESNQRLIIRNPNSTRPWQHVFDALHGYVLLAEKLNTPQHKDFESAFNFSNPENDSISVIDLLGFFPQDLGLSIEVQLNSSPEHEAKFLSLNSDKAQTLLSWRPSLKLSEAIKLILDWQLAYQSGQDMKQFTQSQIVEYLDNVN